MLTGLKQGASDQSWSAIELLDQETLDTIHLSKLRKQLSYTVAKSPFYRDKFKGHGVSVDRVRELSDLENLPFTEKDEIRQTLEESPPLGGHLCVPIEHIIQRQASSGTTGKPSYFGYTPHDLEMVCEMTARCFYAAGFRPGDLILHAFAMSRGFVGGLPMAQSLAHMGAHVLPIGAEAGTERLLRSIADQQPVGMIGAPSLITYLGEQSEVVLGRPASELGIRRILVGSEPGGGQAATRRRLERLWKASVREMYGLSDLGNSFWAEDLRIEGMHFRGQGYLHWELIDPESGAVLPREKGVTGELVYTSVERDAMPLIRFRSRDNAEIIGTDAVGALKGARIRVLGRTDDMLICRGINVYPSAIQDIVNALRPVTSGRFRIAADFQGHSTDRPLVLRVERGETGMQPETAGTEVAAAVRNALGLRVEVLMVPPGTFPPPGAKKTPLIERDHTTAVFKQGDAVVDESI